MELNPDIHRRRSIRVPGYDYSQAGAYFVTIVTHERLCIFGEIENQEMRLNTGGEIVLEVWKYLPERYPQVALGAAVLMPNHFHGIIEIPVGAIHTTPGLRPYVVLRELPLRDTQSRLQRRAMTLPLVVGFFKMQTAKRINILRGTPGLPVWQRNYYEHIIRDEEDHNRIFSYIEANVENWPSDEENPGR